MRLLLLALALAACGPAPADDPDAAYDAYAEALRDGDGDRALAGLEAAAAAGHVEALRELADARHYGYLRVPWSPAQTGAVTLPIRTTPWAAARAARRYERALADSARAGHEGALFHVAVRLLAAREVDGAWVVAEADRDSARAIFRGLEARRADPMLLFGLASVLRDEATADRYVAEAADAGHPAACSIHYFGGADRATWFAAEGLEAAVEHQEACRARAGAAPDDPRFGYATGRLTELAAQAADGNAGAVALLDSLRDRGVFEHPALAGLDA